MYCRGRKPPITVPMIPRVRKAQNRPLVAAWDVAESLNKTREAFLNAINPVVRKR